MATNIVLRHLEAVLPHPLCELSHMEGFVSGALPHETIWSWGSLLMPDEKDMI